MQESPRESRRRIWNVRSSFLQNNSHNTGLYATSAQELISNDPDSVPFYDSALRDLYENLWLPTRIDSPESLSTSSNFSLRNAEGQSWFWAEEREIPQRTNWVRIYSPSFTFSPAGTTGGENIPANPPTTRNDQGNGRKTRSQIAEEKGVHFRARKIRLNPTREQQQRLNQIFAGTRFIYYECVTADREGLLTGASKTESNSWREALTSESGISSFENLDWLKSIPSLTRQTAVEEFFRSKRAAITNVSRGNARRFTMRYRSKAKSRQESISFERFKVHSNPVKAKTHHVKKKRGKKYKPKIAARPSARIIIADQRKEMNIKIRKGDIPKELQGICDDVFRRNEIKIIRTRLGYYYAIILVEIAAKTTSSSEVCALDPGCRTFQTWYSDRGRCGMMGKFEKQQVLLKKADSLKSKMDREGQHKHSTWRRHIRRQYLRVLEKVRNRTDEIHKKTASFLTKTFRIILIPIFKTTRMLGQGFLASKTCRMMQTWSHYKFRQVLQDHAQLYDNVKALTCNEAYTSKTCGNCGNIHHHLGGSEIFTCPTCGFTANRDYQAARCILMRSLPFLLAM